MDFNRKIVSAGIRALTATCVVMAFAFNAYGRTVAGWCFVTSATVHQDLFTTPSQNPDDLTIIYGNTKYFTPLLITLDDSQNIYLDQWLQPYFRPRIFDGVHWRFSDQHSNGRKETFPVSDLMKKEMSQHLIEALYSIFDANINVHEPLATRLDSLVRAFIRRSCLVKLGEKEFALVRDFELDSQLEKRESTDIALLDNINNRLKRKNKALLEWTDQTGNSYICTIGSLVLYPYLVPLSIANVNGNVIFMSYYGLYVWERSSNALHTIELPFDREMVFGFSANSQYVYVYNYFLQTDPSSISIWRIEKERLLCNCKPKR